jgi:hypothetical protein
MAALSPPCTRNNLLFSITQRLNIVSTFTALPTASASFHSQQTILSRRFLDRQG